MTASCRQCSGNCAVCDRRALRQRVRDLEWALEVMLRIHDGRQFIPAASVDDARAVDGEWWLAFVAHVSPERWLGKAAEMSRTEAVRKQAAAIAL